MGYVKHVAHKTNRYLHSLCLLLGCQADFTLVEELDSSAKCSLVCGNSSFV